MCNHAAIIGVGKVGGEWRFTTESTTNLYEVVSCLNATLAASGGLLGLLVHSPHVFKVFAAVEGINHGLGDRYLGHHLGGIRKGGIPGGNLAALRCTR